MRTLADAKLFEVFGDYANQNNSTHLNGGVKDDTLWQNFYNEILPYTANYYDVPKGRMGQRFLTVLAEEFKRCQSCLGNSDQILVFVSIVLQSTKEVRRSEDM